MNVENENKDSINNLELNEIKKNKVYSILKEKNEKINLDIINLKLLTVCSDSIKTDDCILSFNENMKQESYKFMIISEKYIYDNYPDEINKYLKEEEIVENESIEINFPITLNYGYEYKTVFKLNHKPLGKNYFNYIKKNLFCNRFMQKFHINNFLDKNICNYIINVCENTNKWRTQPNYKNETLQISIKNLDELFNLFNNCICNNIFKEIFKRYNINENNVSMNINHLYVCKYIYNRNESFLNFHVDQGHLTFNILLNDTYDGGGVLFQDGLTIHAKPGDLLLHSSINIHAALPIISGIKYALIGMIFLN